MILLLILYKVTTDWSLFSSEVDILPACEICNIINNKLQTNSIFEIVPQNGSKCSIANTTNRYCHLIKNLTNDIKANFPEKIPRSACALIGPCVPNSIPEYTGEYCYPCRFIQMLSHYSKTTNKSDDIKKFCSTTRNVFSNFCNKIDEETRLNSFYNLIDSQKSTIPTEVCANFCKKRPRSKTQKSSREAPHHNKTRIKEDL